MYGANLLEVEILMSNSRSDEKKSLLGGLKPPSYNTSGNGDIQQSASQAGEDIYEAGDEKNSNSDTHEYSPLLSNDENPPSRLEEKKYSELVRRLVNNAMHNKEKLINVRSDEIAGNPVHLRNAKNKANFVSGMQWSVFGVWPVTFAGLMIADLARYAVTPLADQYGNTLGKIFAGTSPNQASISSHFGTDEIDHIGSISVYTMVGAPIVVGAIAVLWNQVYEKYKQDELLVCEEFRNEKIYDVEAALDRLVSRSTYDKNLFAIRSCANIVDLFHESNLTSLAVDEAVKDNMRKRRQTAIDCLKESYIGLYYLWSLGESEARPTNLYWIPFLLKATWILYADARYLEMLIKKIIELAHYYTEKNKCEMAQDDYVYMPIVQNYECTPCGSWPFVNYLDAKTPQGCLDSLLNKPRNPKEITAKLKDFSVKRPGIKKIDFNKQSWISWSDKDFNDVLISLADILSGPVKEINFAVSDKNEVAPSQNKISSINGFLNSVKSEDYCFDNIKIGGNNTALLFDGLQNSTIIRSVSISNTMLGDAGVIAIAEKMPTWPNLTNLDISSNGQLSESIPNLSNATRLHPGLNKFVIANNEINHGDFQKLLEELLDSNVEWLDLSKIPLDAKLVDYLRTKIPTKLTTFIAEGCELNDVLLSKLSPFLKQIASVRLGQNYFQKSSSLKSLVGGQLQDVSLIDCGLDDKSADGIATLIQNGLRRLIISNNEYQHAGMQVIIDAIPGSNLTTFVASEMNIPSTLQLVADLYQNGMDVPVQHWSLRGLNALTQSAKNLFNAMRKVLSVDIGNNIVDESLTDAVSQLMHNNPGLETIIIDHLNQNETVVKTIRNLMPGSSVKKLVFNGNENIDGQGIAEFADATIVQPNGYNIKNLDNEYISRDKGRALSASLPASNVTTVELMHVGVTEGGALALCRSQIASLIKYIVNDNHGYPIDPCDFQTSSGSYAQPLSIYHYVAEAYRGIKGVFSPSDKYSIPTWYPSVENHSTPCVDTRTIKQDKILMDRLVSPSQQSRSQNNAASIDLPSSAIGVLAVSGLVGVMALFYLLCRTQHKSNSSHQMAAKSSRNLLSRQEKRSMKQHEKLQGFGMFQSSSARQHAKRHHEIAKPFSRKTDKFKR